MRRLVSQWAGINSGTLNLDGIEKLSHAVTDAFVVLGGEISSVPVAPLECVDNVGHSILIPLGKAILIRKRPSLSHRALLSIHLDTVYPVDHPFQRVETLDENTLRGPGVADAKGGLAVMLVALEALERSDVAEKIGWDVLLNPDEEIGSPGSTPLLIEATSRCTLGMVFEPAQTDGNLVGRRKGSGNFDAILHGRAAHVGRDFAQGRNAIHAAAEFVTQIENLNGTIPGATFNVAKIDGGGPNNVVPDVAICHLNVRIDEPQHESLVRNEFDRIAHQIRKRDGITIDIKGYFSSPPRPLDQPSERLYRAMAACGKEIDLDLTWRASGGASDANKLAAAGLPVVDSLGPRGGKIHSDQEYVLIDSLTERAKLSALFLIKMAQGEIQWPGSTEVSKDRI